MDAYLDVSFINNKNKIECIVYANGKRIRIIGDSLDFISDTIKNNFCEYNIYNGKFGIDRVLNDLLLSKNVKVNLLEESAIKKDRRTI